MKLHGELHSLDEVIGRAADDGADDCATFGEVDNGHGVGHLELGRLGAPDDRPAVEPAPAFADLPIGLSAVATPAESGSIGARDMTSCTSQIAELTSRAAFPIGSGEDRWCRCRRAGRLWSKLGHGRPLPT